MDRRRKPAAGAKPRSCPVCHQVFGPMTEKLWEVNRRIHDENSVRHLRAKKNRAAYLGVPSTSGHTFNTSLSHENKEG